MSRECVAKTCEVCLGIFVKDPRNTYAYWERAKYCSSKCAGVIQAERFRNKRPSLRQAFEQRAQKTDGCWPWQGLTDKDGYGLLPYGRRVLRAHAVSLDLDGRPVPKGMYACHHCDNPICVRPNHLYAGTPQQNMEDAMSRNRVRRGEATIQAKLTEQAVRNIRNARGMTDIAMSALYGVSRATITLARNGVTWRHVT